MKILKICGIVVGVHVMALLMIVSPGCSASKGQSTPAAAAAKSDAPAPVPAPADLTLPAPAAAPAPVAAADAPAPASGILYSPTRPGTTAATALETPAVTGVTPATAYTVVSGDNLSTIAKKNHLKPSELAKANSLRSGSPLHIGQKLLIPAKAESARTGPAAAKPESAPAPAASSAALPTAGAAKASGESVKHTVKSGETLGAIARKYGVRMGDIATANAITDPQKIRPGQELIIPGGSAHVGKSSAVKAAKPAAAPAKAPAAPAESAPAPAAAAPTPAAAPSANDIPVIKIDDAAPAPAPKP
jgi:LysM repeat protein